MPSAPLYSLTSPAEPSGRKFESPHQVKNHDQLSYLLKPKGIRNEQRKKVVLNTSYSHVSTYRNKDCNCHEYFLLVCYKYDYMCVYNFKHFFLPSLSFLSCNVRYQLILNHSICYKIPEKNEHHSRTFSSSSVEGVSAFLVVCRVVVSCQVE